MAVGFTVLRLPPDALWRMTPQEFRAALKPHAERLQTRATLDRLMAAHPDKEGGR